MYYRYASVCLAAFALCCTAIGLGQSLGDCERLLPDSRLALVRGGDVGYEDYECAQPPQCERDNWYACGHFDNDEGECVSASPQLSGGGKACYWGCLGLADCADACDFDAIQMDAHSIPVVSEAKCTACGDCVDSCPKDLFSLHPADHRLWVACKSLEAGDELADDCEVACTSCGRCAMDGPGLITMQDNLPLVDYSRNHKTKMPIQRCPTGAIVWIDPKAGPQKGPDAKKIIRKGALRDAPS